MTEVAAGVAVTDVGVVTVGVATTGVSGSNTLDSVGSIKPAERAVLVVPVELSAALGVAALMGAASDTPVVVLAAVLPLVPVRTWPGQAL